MSTVEIQPTVITRHQADAVEARASTLADKIAANDGMTAEIELAIKASDDNKKSTFGIHLALMDIFSAEELANLPEPGSMSGQTDNFDRYKYTDTNGAKRNGSFWRSMAQAHPVGAKYMGVIAAVVDASKVANAYTSMSEGQRKQHKKDAEGSFNAFLVKMKDAFSAFGAIIKANELPGVIVTYAEDVQLDDHGKIAKDDKGEV